MPDDDDMQPCGLDEHGRSNSPDRRRDHGQPFATLVSTARRCSKRASGLALDADLIGEPRPPEKTWFFVVLL